MSNYRRSPHVAATQMGSGETVLLHLKNKHYYSLNETGTAIWQVLAEPSTEGAVASALVEEYGISTEEAETEVRRFLSELAEREIVVAAP